MRGLLGISCWWDIRGLWDIRCLWDIRGEPWRGLVEEGVLGVGVELTGSWVALVWVRWVELLSLIGEVLAGGS